MPIFCTSVCYFSVCSKITCYCRVFFRHLSNVFKIVIQYGKHFRFINWWGEDGFI